MTNVLEWQQKHENRYEVRVKCEAEMPINCSNRFTIYHTTNGLRMRARLRRNPSLLMLQQPLSVCDRNGNNLLMIAPKDSNSICENTTHKIKIEMIDDREECNDKVKPFQNGHTDDGSNRSKRTDEAKRKGNDENKEKNKKRYVDDS